MKSRLAKLKWRARRGMLELDTLFAEYLTAHGAQMSEALLLDIECLLELEDQTLFDAFSGKTSLEDERLQALFTQIKQQPDIPPV